MNYRLLSSVLIAGALAASPAHAYTVKGHVSCPDILTEHSTESYRAMNRWWLLGYFTARNYLGDADVGAGIDEDTLYLTALKFCEANAGADWDDAANFTYESVQ